MASILQRIKGKRNQTVIPPAEGETPQVINSALQDTHITSNESGEAVIDEKAQPDIASRRDSATSDEKAVPADDDDRVYPTGLKLIGIVFGLCCSIFLVALDQTISMFVRIRY